MKKLLAAMFVALLMVGCDTFNPPMRKKITVVKIDKEIFDENNMTEGDIFLFDDGELVPSGAGEVIKTIPMAYDWTRIQSNPQVWKAYYGNSLYFCGDEDSAQAILDYYASIGRYPSNTDMGKILREAKGN
jgi:hypothetical protein